MSVENVEDMQTRRLTAMAVPGRNIMVREAIVFMAELSLLDALAISVVTLVSLTAM